MDLKQFKKALEEDKIKLPVLKEGVKVKGIVIKKTEKGLLVNCEEGTFIGLILPKEVKDLERKNYDLGEGIELEAEMLNTELMDEEGYFLISISKLLQYDLWKSMIGNYEKDEILTVVPTEANLGGLLVDIHGIKGFIPLSQLAPVNYPRVEDGDQEKIFERILELIGKEFRVRIINLDEDGKRMIFSEREALREERDKIMETLKEGSSFDGVISGVSSYGLFVTIGGGIEGLVHISEITFGHVDNIERYGSVGDNVSVKVIGLEDGKISLSMKKLKGDPWSIIPKKFKIGDVLEGEVVRFVPYGAFIRVYQDINGLIHLSEITDRPIGNPAEVLRLGQVVKAKLILLDCQKRKLGLSVKAMKKDSLKPRVIKKPEVERKPIEIKPETTEEE